ncbi:unnamed protein product [Medioppia subpectinata]|uniref:F-box domain-containing protein n=1 Tax=Medioppia subpectinata TaxID=1979941 RepID=A0A7R9PVB2_9ACAR|nr:unnamed protein product [Medioppia subpectinata]CAG2102642.1 unnamed protein product [Medioppia subpectinata]
MNDSVKKRRKRATKSGQWLTLETLPTDILYVIVGYCDTRSLLCLSRCSQKLFHFVTNDPYVWLNQSLNVLATNQTSPQIQCRSSRLLSPIEKCRISSKWRNGVYNEKIIIGHKCRYMPWICLQNDLLWFTKGSQIIKYKRNVKNGSISKHLVQKVLKTNEDICRFVVREEFVVSCGRKGTIAVWDKCCDKRVLYQNQLHLNDINCVDFSKNKTIISGSKDKHIKIWSLVCDKWESNYALRLEKTIAVNDRVLSLAINEFSGNFISGSAGCGPLQPLLLFDIQSGQLLDQFGVDHKRGAGVLHSFWESNNEVFSCGYDSFVRLWDTSVINMEDPHDSVVYCISSDHSFTVMSGTARYGLTRLWDKRYPKKCIQMYYVGTNNSPVYSLSFDPLCAYIALESSINLLSFN